MLPGTPGRFRRKVSEVTAIQWTGDNEVELRAFAAAHGGELDFTPDGGAVGMTTIHGETALARLGDWVVPESVPGRFYPVQRDVFAATYEPA